MDDYLFKSIAVLTRASKGNPITSTLTVMLFYLFFNLVEAAIEKQITGAYFIHVFDIFFSVAFMSYAAYGVCGCSLFVEHKECQGDPHE